MGYTLRDYQQEAVDHTLQHFRERKSPAVIVLPTGAGKSLIVAELARLARGRVLVLAHVKELVEQNCEKYQSFGLEAGIFSAGLGKKDHQQKVIFGSIQSVARAPENFFQDFSLLIIDECHRVSLEGETQYQEVIKKLITENPELCALGLTATPYRLGQGWIYKYHYKGILRTEEARFFSKCIYEVTIKDLIERKFLTRPIRIDSPVASYDFSDLDLDPGRQNFSTKEIERIIKEQKRITPVIVSNIIEIAGDRSGVLIFTGSVKHAEEVLKYLPKELSALIVGDTPDEIRDEIIDKIRNKELKFVVNVSVLTTGFDAPHIDLIAIMRPTESVSLFQQIVGRGLRLSPGKKDCLVLDYTNSAHNIFDPEIDGRRPREDSSPVEIECPDCGFYNDFWGITDDEGRVLEHFGRKCRGAAEEPETMAVKPCGYRFRFKICDGCGSENDITARECNKCGIAFVDPDTKLKQARLMKDAHVMQPDSMYFEKTEDKKGKPRLEVKYYDLDGQFLREFFSLQSEDDCKKFFYNFARMHTKTPGRAMSFRSIEEVIERHTEFMVPAYVIARKQKYFWRVQEKIFWHSKKSVLP